MQIKLPMAREAGSVRELQLERVVTIGGQPTIETLLTLDRDASGRLIDLARAIEHVPVEGGEDTVRIDDPTLHDFLTDPGALARLYDSDPRAVP